MHWQIYQAYRQGPSALFRLFEATFGKHTLSGEPEPDMQEREIEALSQDITRLQAQIERLQAKVSHLRSLTFQLQRRNTELEALLVKDSHNSSRPPSTDPPWAKKTRNLRLPSGKRAGGQAGHQGSTLRLAARPSRVVEHRPPECRNCQASAAVTLAKAGKLDEAIGEVKGFHHHLCNVRVLDPACGTGNFLYVTLEHIKRLGIEVNPRAAAIADLVLT
jgi:TolA-binding protein